LLLLEETEPLVGMQVDTQWIVMGQIISLFVIHVDEEFSSFFRVLGPSSVPKTNKFTSLTARSER
jgi:hypothetical protein